MAERPHAYPTGVPCWIDLTASDLDASTRFYGGLFGWEFANAMPAGAPGAYLIATLDGKDAAAIAPAGGGQGWMSYIATDDVEATAVAVAEAGGRVLEAPSDVGDAGRSAECGDPQGATFRLWQPARRLGAQAVNVPGAWNFSNLHTPDVAASVDFYGTVFGWQVSDDLGAGMVRLPGYGDFLQSTVDPDIYERQKFAPEGFADVIAGIAPTEERARWAIGFTVRDRDATATRAAELGGRVVSREDTDWTREAVIADPHGAQFTVSQLVIPDDLVNDEYRDTYGT